ncbi:unnamed protein product [Ectocarpus fasciculatus]
MGDANDLLLSGVAAPASGAAPVLPTEPTQAGTVASAPAAVGAGDERGGGGGGGGSDSRSRRASSGGSCRAGLVPGGGWDFVDVDPFGSCLPFLEAAVGAVADGGVLAVAATDLAVLCGKSRGGGRKGCLSQYQASVADRPYAKEAAIRVLLYRLDKLARRRGRRISPLLCVALDFYVRLFVLILPTPDEGADGVSTPFERRAPPPPPVLWVDQTRESPRFRCYNDNNRTLNSSSGNDGDGGGGGGGGSAPLPIHRRGENDSCANPRDGVPGSSSIGKNDAAGRMEGAHSETRAAGGVQAAATGKSGAVMAQQHRSVPEAHTRGDKRNGAGMRNGLGTEEENGSGRHERGPGEAPQGGGLRGSEGGGRMAGCRLLPSVEAVREQLRSAGHECSGSHADPRAIKTKAPLEAVGEAVFRAEKVCTLPLPPGVDWPRSNSGELFRVPGRYCCLERGDFLCVHPP